MTTIYNDFSYTTFDRQISNLLLMATAVVTGWDDYSSQEMSSDLHSLVLKAQKVCYLADQDQALQTDNLINERQPQNHALCRQFNEFMRHTLGPFMIRMCGQIKEKQGMHGHKSPAFSQGMSSLLPMLAQKLDDDGSIAIITQQTAVLEKVLQKLEGPVTYPGMSDMQRFWMLYEFYTLMCYLLLHFQTLTQQETTELKPQEMGRLLGAALLQYALSDAGSLELQRYLEALRFDHEGVLTLKVLREARIGLRKEVPETLQLCFMQHIEDLDALGRSLLEVEHKSADDLKQLLSVVAKWQLLTSEMEIHLHPVIQKPEPDLPNKVFTTWRHDKPVKLEDLKAKIARMLPLVKQKNHWFCVWCVLRYHNYLEDLSAEAFAQQMCQPEWFGQQEGFLPFNGDTLREYSGYFTDRNFTLWNEEGYSLYKKTHHKTKWGDSLCQNFLRKCYEMDEAFTESA